MLTCCDCGETIQNGSVFYQLEHGNYCSGCMSDRMRIASYVKQSSLDDFFPELKNTLNKLTVYGGENK